MNLSVMSKFVYDTKNSNNIECFHGEELNWYDWFKEHVQTPRMHKLLTVTDFISYNLW